MVSALGWPFGLASELGDRRLRKLAGGGDEDRPLLSGTVLGLGQESPRQPIRARAVSSASTTTSEGPANASVPMRWPS